MNIHESTCIYMQRENNIILYCTLGISVRHACWIVWEEIELNYIPLRGYNTYASVRVYVYDVYCTSYVVYTVRRTVCTLNACTVYTRKLYTVRVYMCECVHGCVEACMCMCVYENVRCTL